MSIHDWDQQKPALTDSTPLGETPAAPDAPQLADWDTQNGISKLQSSMTLAKQKAPDQMARVLKLVGRTGLDQELVERNLDAIEAKVNEPDFDPVAFRQDVPALAAWLSDVNNAALAQN